MATFADRLVEALQRKNMTAAELSRQLGVDEGTISNYKKGKYAPKQRRTEAIANILGVPINWLMGAEVSMYNGKTTSSKGVQIPVLGTVPAGIPIEAVEDIIGYEEISEKVAQQGEYFALRVKGDSMEPKISSGDVVIVRKQEDVDSGDIAIVMVNGDEATIKKVKKFDGGINLIPFNNAYDVMTFSNKDIKTLPVSILGKVVELRAKF